MRSHSPRLVQMSFPVYPSASVSDVVVEPYNAILATHKLIDSCDEVMVRNYSIADSRCSVLSVHRHIYVIVTSMF